MSELGAGQAGDKRIDRQIVLPFKKSLEITIKNLRVRFFRSLITVASLVLAVSFLAYVLVGGNIVAGLAEKGGPETCDMLVKCGYDLSPEAGTPGAGPKERWIVILSLLVCTVGIVNAQLMSVTERFREIGVMKCLGALDTIILRLFLMESAIMGLAGACAGAVLGLFAAMLQGLIRFGLDSWGALAFTDVLGSLGLSVLVGCVLSVLGVSYPAIVAARMRPVVAMRAEL